MSKGVLEGVPEGVPREAEPSGSVPSYTNGNGEWNPFARFSFAFMNPLFRLGARRPLEQSDLGELLEDERVARVGESFREHFGSELKLPKEQRSIWRPLRRTVGFVGPLLALLLQGIGSGCGFAPPLILKALTRHFIGAKFFPNDQLSNDTLWTLVCMLFVIPVSGTLCSGNSYVLFAHYGTKCRNALVPAVYKKALVIGSGAKATFSTGQIMNLFANDISNIQNLIQNFAEPAFGLPQLVAALALIYQEMDVSMFVGLGLICTVVPIMVVAIMVLTHNRGLKIIEGDLRIKLTNEVLSGIRILKYFGWERAFEKKIDEVREQELVYLLRMNGMMPIFIFCILMIPIIMPVLMFYTYVRLGKQLDPSKTFTVLSLFGLIITPVYLIPTLIQNYILAKISAERINRFLLSDELPEYVCKEGGPLGLAGSDGDKDVVICMEHASLSWLTAEESSSAAKAEKDAADEAEKRRNKAAGVKGQNISKNGDKEYTAVPSSAAAATDVKVVAAEGEGIELVVVDQNANESSIVAAAAGPSQNRSVCTLVDINVTIRRGECVAIVGLVGSGKSSFLAGLLGELQPTQAASLSAGQPPHGAVYMKGAVAYHSQTPWILNATVKENIIFGGTYDEERFRKALECSCLAPDIAMLPDGLETEIGERGINLSGGQKARVSFARCVYRDADVILLDDPLSAVDAHVGEHIFRKGIREGLRGKTVVLVTHQIHLIDDFDSVIVMSDGAIKAQGPPAQVRHLVEASVLASSGDSSPKKDAKESDDEDDKEGAMTERLPAGSLGRKSSLSDAKVSDVGRDRAASATKPTQGSPEAPDKPQAGALMTEEERATNNVSWRVYKYYFVHGGILWILGVVFVAAFSSGIYAYSNFWLSDWGKENVRRQILAHFHVGTVMSESENIDWFNIYACLNMMYVIGSSFRTCVSIWSAYNSSRNMHRHLLKRVLRAPVSFFDTTPLGRIINRFSADITQSDEKLGYTLGFFIGLSCNLISIIITICITTDGYFAIALPVLFYIYFHVQRFFRKTNTELKRLENISRSPILTEFSQALTGATSLRAFGESSKYVERMEKSVDENTTVTILLQIARWWLAVRLDVIGGTTSFFIAALCAGDPTIIPPAYLSLALQQAFSMTTFLKNMVQMGSDVEAAMSNIERVKYYSEEIPLEEPLWRHPTDPKALLSEDEEDRIMAAHAPPPDWPPRGDIEFSNVSMRYRDGPLVLKGLSAVCLAESKVGIAGRTGSGKSSLMVSLFRMSPIEGAEDNGVAPGGDKEKPGCITIDGVDIGKLPLQCLRSKLGIVPQDPVMFSASLRYNLDPFNKYSDEQIWDVLDSVQLKEKVGGLEGKLDFGVSEGGENFSTGERQLINLARVLLRQPRVLVLDEATASIDNETDQLINKMIKTRFKNCTVLTIAHRLGSIIDSDNIMVLDKGRLAEHAPPQKLLENSTGLFATLWAQYLQSHAENDKDKGKK